MSLSLQRVSFLFWIPTVNRNPRESSHLFLLKKPTMSSSSSSSWTCKKCTFMNSPTQKPTCKICLTNNFSCSPPSSPPRSQSSSSVPKWSCKACTFLNTYKNTNCELCGTTRAFFMSSFEDLNDVSGGDGDVDSSVGSVFLPLKSCNSKKRKSSEDPVVFNDEGVDDCGSDGFKALKKVVDVKENTDSMVVSKPLKIMSYNVWFREDLELYRRMKALGDLIQLHSPDIICFQEVTADIYDIFCQSNWWKIYNCSISPEKAASMGYSCMLLSKVPVRSFNSIPFGNSIMGRELSIAEVEVQGAKPLVVATSHLESPCPGPPKWDQMFSKERVDQAKEAIDILKKNPNVIFGGDMNWDDRLDGPFPLGDGWVDAWSELKPGENGWTYDTKSNQMLTGNRTLQKRLDRFACKLQDYKINGIDMIGKEAIPGLFYCKEKKTKKEIKMLELPVLPSDHYGLLLTISGQ